MRMFSILTTAVLFLAGISQFTPVATEHGWKTERVVATRYKNRAMGYNIGFTYPMNPNDCDRAELFKFMEKNGGNVYQGGGYPGAEMFVTFKDVTDRASADIKIKSILPELSKLVASLGK